MISPKEINKLAELSRLALTDEEKGALTGDIEKIVSYISELQSVEVEKLNNEIINIQINVMREDANPHEIGIYSKDLLSAAPQRKGDFFVVKKIL